MSLTPEINQQLIDKLGEKHIMLSYQWGVQDLVRTTYEYIESLGIPVWMDIKGGVTGNINAAMAKGVEGASVICPFMTELYQSSESCELELNYSKDRRVPIVPCMVQDRGTDGSSYRASGWLGVITAGKLWLDFRNTDDSSDVADRSDRLLVEIANQLQIDTRPGFKPAGQPPKPAAAQKQPVAAAPIQATPQVSPPVQDAEGGQKQITGEWQKLSGGLTRVSIGQAGLWGVNSNEDIYEWEGFSWKKVSGKLVHVAVGSEVWGVNSSDAIYKWLRGSWQCISGKLTNIDVSDNGNVWGVNRGQQIYRRKGDSWECIGGAAVQVSTGESGVWVVNAGDDIYYRTGTFGDVDSAGDSWLHIDGKLKWIASGPGLVVGVNKSDQIYYRAGICTAKPEGECWVQVARGRLAQIDIQEGTAFGINANMEIWKSPVRAYAGRRFINAWSKIPGKLTRVSYGTAGLWGVNSGDDIYEWSGHSWTHQSGKLVHVAVGKSVWGVNSNDDIYTWLGSSWKLISGKLTNIDVSNKGHVWGINRSDEIYRRNGDSWQKTDGGAVQVSVGESGVWVVNGNCDIYYRKGTFGDVDTAGDGWTHIGGKLKWISSGPGIVVGVNSSDDIYYRAGVSAANPTGEKWIHVQGKKLAQIDVDHDAVFGRNGDMDICKTALL